MEQQPTAQPTNPKTAGEAPVSGALHVENVKSADALVLNKAALEKLHAIAATLIKESGSHDGRIRTAIRKKSGLRSEVTLEELLEDRNSRAEAIISVEFSAKDGDTQSKVQIGPWDNTLIAEGVSRNLKALKTFKHEMELELENVRIWYSTFRRSWVAFWNGVGPKILIFGMMGVAAICFIGLIISGINSSREWEEYKERIQEEARRAQLSKVDPGPIPKAPDALAVPAEAPSHWIRTIVLNVVTFISAALLGHFLMWGFRKGGVALFPSIVFDLGEGHDRYENIRKWRWFVLGSVLVSGIGLRLILSLVSPK